MSDPAEIIELSDDRAEALVRLRGKVRRLSLAALTLDGREVRPGDWVLASAGLAVEQIDATEARKLLAFLDGEDRP